MCGSFISIGNSLSQLKVSLMNSITIKLHVENTRSILVYAEEIATREHILKIFAPDFMVRLNHHVIDNGDDKFHPSYFPVEFNPESVPYIDTTTIKFIDDDEMGRILEFSH